MKFIKRAHMSGVATAIVAPGALRRIWPAWARVWRRGPVLAWALVAATAATQAQESAHRHGAIRMEVAVEAGSLTVRLEAPLDSLLGFEHRPRNDSQRRAADALLARMRSAPELLVPTPAAQCSVKDIAVEADVLAPAKAVGAQQTQDKHAELEATYAFTCLQPGKLQSLEVGLFAAFPRLQRIDARVVSSRSQAAVTLRRPQQVLRIGK